MRTVLGWIVIGLLVGLTPVLLLVDGAMEAIHAAHLWWRRKLYGSNQGV